MSLVLRFGRLLPFAAAISGAVVLLVGSAACNAQVATVLSSDAGDGVSPDGGGGGGGGGGAVCAADPDCNDDPNANALWGSCTGGACVCRPGFTKQPSGKCGTSTTGSVDCSTKGGKCVDGHSKPPDGYRLAGAGEGTCSGSASCWLPITTVPAGVCSKDQDCNNDPSVSALWGTCFYGVCMCHAGHTVQANGKCDTAPPPDCMTQKGTCRQAPAQCQAFEIGSEQSTNMSCGDVTEAICCNSVKLCKGPARQAAGGVSAGVAFVCCPGNDGTVPPICVNGWTVCPSGSSPLEAAMCPGG
jgi:hypothetical protein